MNLLGGNREQVAVEHQQIRGLAHLDRSGVALLELDASAIDRVRGERLGEGDPMLGEPGWAGWGLRIATCDRNLDRRQRIERRRRPVAPAATTAPVRLTLPIG
jgi:hypothetical protein